MSCYDPIEAFDFREAYNSIYALADPSDRSRYLREYTMLLFDNGFSVSYVRHLSDKGNIAFRLPDDFYNYSVEFVDSILSTCRIKRIYLPCGKCLDCQLKRSREWALRCMHEASLHDENCFITLTFRDDVKTKTDSLEPKIFVDFMKRFRKAIEPTKIRFFHCGEYGTSGGKPHHHACIFGYNFPDRYVWRVDTASGCVVYRSPLLEKLWPFGFSTIGEVTFESAAYVARYVIKKQYGEKAREHYGKRIPEYITMSRRPGIASDWITTHTSDVYPKDFITLKRGTVTMKPPRFYDKIYEEMNPQDMERIKKCRSENTPDIYLTDADRHNLKKIESAKRDNYKSRLPRNLEKLNG